MAFRFFFAQVFNICIGASNTTNFAVGSASAVQLFPCIKNLIQEIKADDLNVVKKLATAFTMLRIRLLSMKATILLT